MSQGYRGVYPSLFRAEVATPGDYDMPYVPLDLKTEDDVILKCYLLLQKKESGLNSNYLPVPVGMSEEEVC